MNVKRVTRQNKDYLPIKKLYNAAFPIEERIPFWMLILRAKAKWMDFLAFYDEGQLCGIACLSHSERLTSILYLAVDSQLRSKGYGTKILTYIKNKYKDHTVVLEIETVVKEAANYEQRKKRKEFYIRNGFTDSGYGVRLYKVKYDVLKSKAAFEPKDWCELTGRLMFGIFKLKMHRVNNNS